MPKQKYKSKRGKCVSCEAKAKLYRFQGEWICRACMNPPSELDIRDYMIKDRHPLQEIEEIY